MGGDNQKWSVIRSGTGTDQVYLVPKIGTNVRMGVQYSSPAAGVNIQLQTVGTGAAQIFKLQKVEQPVTTNVYTIEASYANKLVDVSGWGYTNGTNVAMWQPQGGGNQEFAINYDAQTGYYTIMSMWASKMLDVEGSAAAAGTNVDIWLSNGGLNQKWVIESDGGYFRIYSACNGLALDVSNTSTANGANVCVWTPNGGANQKFRLTNVTTATTSLPNGVYTIGAGYANLVLDVEGNGSANGTNVLLWTPNGGTNQKFRFTLDQATGCYLITSVPSGKALDVAGSATTAGTNVAIWQPNGGFNQLWAVFPVDSLHYRLAPRHALSSLRLDAANAGAANGTNVLIWSEGRYRTSGNANQMWTIKP